MQQGIRHLPMIAVAILTLLFGLAFVGLGGWLVSLGGTAYYVVAGIALTISGAVLLRGRPWGLWLYAATFVATIAWAIGEVGLDGWQLMPRLVAPAVLGLLIAFVVGARSEPGRRRAATICGALFAFSIVGVVAAGWAVTAARTATYSALTDTGPTATSSTAANDDWRYYGRTPDGQRYAPQGGITPQNVAQLTQAWRYDTGDVARKGENDDGHEFNFEVTPIKVGDALYLCTPHRHVIALDATTGAKRWEFDPQADTSADMYLACRGVAYDEDAAATDCPKKIVTTTATARMVALDATTGKPCESFGDHGFVSLTDHLGPTPPGFHYITSQPMVMHGRIVLGGWVYDNQTVGEPSGVVRAYDAHSGKLAWAWDMGRADPTAPLGDGETYTRGTPNGWGTYTADEALGLVYIPLGNATPDYYGAKRRPFDDEYSSAILALDIATGRERWHFQTVHHDVWDFDLPIGPSLIDLRGPNGTMIPALVQSTKMGDFFVLDRRTGKPLSGIDERRVPTGGGLPGDRLSPTQPLQADFPTLAPPDLRAEDAWGATPIDQLWCRIEFKRARYDGRYTPPSLGTAIAYPAFDGVTDWYGASIDPRHKLLIANSSYIPFTMEGIPQAEAIRRGMMKPWAGWASGQPYPKPKDFSVGPQYGTPYAVVVKPWLGPLQAPCAAPPWGKLTAIDLETRKVVWDRPLGTTRDMNLFGTHTNVPLPTGMFSIGGNIVTGGGLVFLGAMADDYLRAIDEKTGKELWKARLPAGGQATPMTYTGADGRQFVVIAAGGHGGLRTRSGDSIVAFALPASTAGAKPVRTAAVTGR